MEFIPVVEVKTQRERERASKLMKLHEISINTKECTMSFVITASTYGSLDDVVLEKLGKWVGEPGTFCSCLVCLGLFVPVLKKKDENSVY